MEQSSKSETPQAQQPAPLVEITKGPSWLQDSLKTFNEKGRVHVVSDDSLSRRQDCMANAPDVYDRGCLGAVG